MSRRKKHTLVISCIIGLLMIMIALLITSAIAKTIIVDDDGGVNYERIQDAINASEDGDVIEVREGIYYESIVVNKSVSLVGSGSEHTTINASYSNDVVTITADSVSISSINIIDGGYSGNWPYHCGINVTSNHTIISNSTITNNQIGILLQDSQFNTIRNNQCFNTSNGIILRHSDQNELMNNSCFSNEHSGINVYLSDNNTVVENDCRSNSEGIRISNGNSNYVSRNICNENIHFGISLRNSNHTIIANNTVSNNIYNGISIGNGNYNVISYNIISKNTDGIRVGVGGGDDVIINFNDIFQNSDHGIDIDINYEAMTINAKENWWGDMSGPYHSLANPRGDGDEVCDHVDFTPWLRERVNPGPPSYENDPEFNPVPLLTVVVSLVCLLLAIYYYIYSRNKSELL